MPRQPLDAGKDLTKERSRQVAFGELQREVPACRMSRPPVLRSRCCRLVSDQSWIGDHAARALPGGGLVLEAVVADQRRVTWSAARPSEQILDLPLEHVIGRQPNRVTHPPAVQSLVERRHGERGVRPEHQGLPTLAVPINDAKQDLVPPFRTVDVARPEFCREAITLRVEDEERVM